MIVLSLEEYERHMQLVQQQAADLIDICGLLGVAGDCTTDAIKERINAYKDVVAAAKLLRVIVIEKGHMSPQFFEAFRGVSSAIRALDGEVQS